MKKNTIQAIGFFGSLFIAVTIAIIFFDQTVKQNYFIPMTSLSFIGIMLFFGFGYNRKKQSIGNDSQ